LGALELAALERVLAFAFAFALAFALALTTAPRTATLASSPNDRTIDDDDDDDSPRAPRRSAPTTANILSSSFARPRGDFRFDSIRSIDAHDGIDARQPPTARLARAHASRPNASRTHVSTSRLARGVFTHIRRSSPPTNSSSIAPRVRSVTRSLSLDAHRS
jgi:hypothetical protein